MPWTLILAALIVAVLVAAIVVGWKLPPAHRAAREAEFGRSAEAVWTAITDFNGLPTWMPGVRAVQKVDAVDGNERWRYQTAEGEMTIEVVRRSAPTELVIRTVNSDLAFGGTWTYKISPAARGSLVAITEDGWISNPFFRFMARYVFGPASTIEQTLVALGRHMGETVAPQRPRARAYLEPPAAAPVETPEDATRSL